MFRRIKKLGRSIVPLLMLTIGLALLMGMLTLAYFDIRHHDAVYHTIAPQPTGKPVNSIKPGIPKEIAQTTLYSGKQIFFRTMTVFMGAVISIFMSILWFVNRPIRKLIQTEKAGNASQ